MLFDPKWAETKADPTKLETLIAWLECQPADKEYDYFNCDGGCLLGQYLNGIGLSWKGRKGAGHDIWEKSLWAGIFGTISVRHPRTFGGALERAREALGNAKWR